MIFRVLFKVVKIKSKYTIMDFAEYIDESFFKIYQIVWIYIIITSFRILYCRCIYKFVIAEPARVVRA